MDKELILEGKKYISARRASEISGYNSDYLGQLCRSDKLACKLVSRTWFVEEGSVLAHIKQFGRKKNSRISKIKKRFPESITDIERTFFSGNQKIALDSIKSEFFNNRLNNKFFSYKKILANLLIATFVIFSLVIVVLDTSNLVSENKTYFIGSAETFVGSVSRSVLGKLNYGLKNISDFLALKTDRALSKFAGFKNRIAVNDQKNNLNSDLKLFPDENGLVTVPILSDSDASALSTVRNYLRSSFSDEVEVIPDESGVAGVIKPVFAEPTEEEYLYVMVPMR